jgi:hypothetical protein
LSVPLGLNYSKKIVDDAKPSYDKNHWNVALKLSKTAHSRPLHLHGVFVSTGFEGPFRQTHEPLKSASAQVSKSTSNGVTTTSTNAINLTETGFPKTRDRTISGGLTFDDIGDRPVAVTGLSASLVYVQRHADITGLTIAGDPITADQLAQSGAAKLANAKFLSDPAKVAANPTIVYESDDTANWRLDTSGTATWKIHKANAGQQTLTLDVRYRWYPDTLGKGRLFVARQLFEPKLKLTLPAINRVKATPYVNFFWVRLRDPKDGTIPPSFRLVEYGFAFEIPLFGSWGPGHADR